MLLSTRATETLTGCHLPREVRMRRFSRGVVNPFSLPHLPGTFSAASAAPLAVAEAEAEASLWSAEHSNSHCQCLVDDL